MKMHNLNDFVKYAIDESTTSNDWLDRYESQQFAKLRKAKAQTTAKRTQDRQRQGAHA